MRLLQRLYDPSCTPVSVHRLAPIHTQMQKKCYSRKFLTGSGSAMRLDCITVCCGVLLVLDALCAIVLCMLLACMRACVHKCMLSMCIHIGTTSYGSFAVFRPNWLHGRTRAAAPVPKRLAQWVMTQGPSYLLLLFIHRHPPLHCLGTQTSLC